MVHVTDTQGNPVPEAEVTVGWTWGGDVSGKSATSSNYEKGVANKQGVYRYSGITKGSVWVSSIKDGYYHTYVGEVEENPIKVELRKKVNPTPLYAKEASIDLPSGDGRYGYDLFVGDLVSPHGEGNTADLFFVVHTTTMKWRNEVQLQLHGDIEFPHPKDGIQSFFILNRVLPKSKYQFPFTAPVAGYLASLSEANSQFPEYFNKEVQMGDSEAPNYWYWTDNIKRKVNSRDWFEEVHYFIKTRSGQNASGYYGFIQGSFRFGIHGKDIPNASFKYYINPDQSPNIEYDKKLNLMKRFGGYRTFEYSP